MFFPTHLSCKCLSVSASADFPLHYPQSYTVRIDASVSGYRDQRNSRTLATLLPLPPFFIHCSCTDGGYCFDSADGEQDVEEGSAHHCWWVGAKDALFLNTWRKIINLDFEVISENTVLFLLHSKLPTKLPQTNSFHRDKKNNHKDTKPHLLYFLLHILQLTLPLPPLNVEPLQQLGSLPWPVPLIVLQATA